jgi:hypothetical protein
MSVAAYLANQDAEPTFTQSVDDATIKQALRIVKDIPRLASEGTGCDIVCALLC